MSEESLFSAQWHRVKDVCPKLADDVDIFRHVYRGRVFYVLHRRATSDSHKLDALTYELIDKLDGEISVGEVWDQAIVERDESAPTQDEWIGLLGELYAVELITVDRRVPSERLFERRQKHRASELKQRYLNPLYLRFSLHDPDAWLTRLEPFSKMVFSRMAGYLWLALIGAALAVLLIQAERFLSDVSETTLLSPRNIVLFLLIYPPMKLLHEFAHALAVKRRGGHVREMGFALMVLLPLPYVDASASSLFPDKYDRMLVSSAGILVELACAAIGVLIWGSTQGLLQEIGLIMVLAGGISTLVLNGNPLLKFDGYYLLADLIEIPNLAKHSRSYVLGKFRFWITGTADSTHENPDKAEKCWLFGYGVCSSLYRTLLMLSIAWMLSSRWFFFGVLLALVAVYFTLILPLWRAFKSLTSDPVYHSPRTAMSICLVPVCALLMAFKVPVPYSNVVQGVVWLPEEAVIRVRSQCMIVKEVATPGHDVKTGDELFVCDSPESKIQQRELLAIADEIKARRAGLATHDPLALEALEAEMKSIQAALDDIALRIQEGAYVAEADGRYDITGTSALIGRALERGDIVGYVVSEKERTVRVAIEEDEIGPVDQSLQQVRLRLPAPDGASEELDTQVLRRMPKASRRVTSAALGSEGGGMHEADPQGDGRLLLKSVFEVELKWPESAAMIPVGMHVNVRFVYASEPLVKRVRTSIRQALESRVES